MYGLDFMDFDSALTPEEREFRRRAEHIMDKLVRPHTIPLYENAEFDQSLFVGACKQFGPAGLQIKGYGRFFCLRSLSSIVSFLFLRQSSRLNWK